MLLPGKSLLLPTEVLDLILRLLPRPALQAAALVCRRWREVAEAPGLWAWLRLTATRKNLSSLPRLLDTRRMQGVRKLSLGALSRRLLEAVERHRGLRSLDISCRKMAPVEPELLARAVCSVQEVKVDKLTDHQVRAVLLQITTGESSIKKLRLGSYCDLSSLEAGLLARAANMLEEVELFGQQLASSKVEAILLGLDSQSSLRVLAVRPDDLSSLQPSLLAQAAPRLEDITLSGSSLTSLQLEELLSSVAAGPGKLRKLQLLTFHPPSLSSLAPSLLARAVHLLEEVLLCFPVDRQLVEAVLAHSGDNSRLGRLRIGQVCGGHLPEELVKTAKIKYSLNLEYSKNLGNI